jgi:release factor glutamine methyltransferase
MIKNTKNKKTKRQLSAYEKTHLARFGKNIEDIFSYDEMPVEDITGNVEFLNHVFKVNSSTLIPRIESEQLIKLGLEFIIHQLTAKQTKQKNYPKKIAIAEVGTGCGAIGLSLLLELLKKNLAVEMVLSDISKPALKLAKYNYKNLIENKNTQFNLKKNPWQFQLHFVESNLLAKYPTKLKFDLMIANLPYIPTKRIALLDKAVSKYEPHLALDGGEDGLELIKNLIIQSKKYLLPHGQLILEIDYTHDYHYLIKNLDLTNFHLMIKRDQFHRTRFAILLAK